MLDSGARAWDPYWLDGCAVHAWVVATDAAATPMPGARVHVACEPFVNGVSQGIVLSGSGQGAVVAARPFSMVAGRTDVVTMCEHVTVDGETGMTCPDAVGFSPCPQPVLDAANLLFADVLHADDLTGSEEISCDNYRTG